MMGNWGHGGWSMMGPLEWFVSLLFLALIVLSITYLWRALEMRRSVRQEPGGRDRAVDIARERYAKGEISQEEFETLKRDL